MDAAEEHEVTEDHQSLDMVAPRVTEDIADDVIDWRDAGGAGVEGIRDGVMVVPEVEPANVAAAVFVDAMDEFPPADDLADEAFEGIERSFRFI